MQMEVARPPGGFLLPHQIYHETRPTTNAAPAATAGGPRVTAPHEFYDGSMMATRSVPASASAVAGLPQTTVAASGEESGDGGSACAVCLEAYAAGDALRTMPCAHAFHEGCIVEWLSVSPLCPLCRFKLPTQAEEDAAQPQQPPRLG
ncbi:E3 ubiquitin-protein ligase RNF181 [Setaria italica]|nr:E3 ubiquitin-protein ligase RNF181 [Setaria italica]XP_034604902.1 E3 ubiquitin-protein ligase RNF181-like [Setaria viridis]